MRQRVGRWTVYTYLDGEFNHARHTDPSMLIAWTLDEFEAADPVAFAEYHQRVTEPSR